MPPGGSETHNSVKKTQSRVSRPCETLLYETRRLEASKLSMRNVSYTNEA